jgi:hypothetical protein
MGKKMRERERERERDMMRGFSFQFFEQVVAKRRHHRFKSVNFGWGVKRVLC